MEPLSFNFALPIEPMPPYQRGSATSKDAAIRAQDFVGEQGQRVLIWIAKQGEHGATQREAAAALTIGRPSIAARFNALAGTHAILKTGTRREGCAVYRVINGVSVKRSR